MQSHLKTLVKKIMSQSQETVCRDAGNLYPQLTDRKKEEQKEKGEGDEKEKEKKDRS